MAVFASRRPGQLSRRFAGILFGFFLALIQYGSVRANLIAQPLPLSQDWSNAGLITVADDWTSVPGIQGYRGDDLTTATGTNPQTILADGTGTPVNVIANQASTGLSTGGVAEFDGITNRTIALQGSGTADAPFILISLDTTAKGNVNVAYNLRDIDGTADNAVQPVALQYRVGGSGTFTNLPAGFVADASSGPSLATLVTPVSVTLPAAADNQPLVQVRIITTNAVGNDEWIGIDDISITGGDFVPQQTNPSGSGSATPNSAPAGGSTLLAVAVTPGTNPPSTGLGVFADLTTIGGASQQVFQDDGLGGDVTANDGTFSFLAAIPQIAPGLRALPFTVTDAQTRGGSGSILFTVAQPPPPAKPISAIQGPGATSPLVNTTVTAEGIVTARKSNGFFIQTADGEDDGDPATSEGIFVFTSSTPDAAAAVGARVSVTATVQEFIPSQDVNSPPATELINAVITVVSPQNPLPAPVVLTAADTNPADPDGTLARLEQLEGMRVLVNSLTVVAPTDGLLSEANATSTSDGVFYGVITGVARPFREPGVQVPDPLPADAPPNIARFDGNPERIRVDSDGQPGAPKIDVAAGQLVGNLVGPLDYSFRTYTILPDPATPATVSGSIALTPVSAPQGGEFTIGSQNFERFFDTVNDPSISDVALTPTAFANRLNKASLTIRSILRSPDVLGVVEMENLSTLQQLANKVNSDAVAAGQPDPMYIPYLAEGNDIGGIDSGFLVKSSRVTVIDVTQAGKDDTYINPNNGAPEILNDRPPLILRGEIANAAGPDFPVTVIVNHLRSLSGVDDPVDGNRIRTKRRAQAEFLANLVQARQLADPDEHIVLVGDFNAFAFNDGYVDSMGIIRGSPAPADEDLLGSSDLVNPDLMDLIDTLPAEQRYSFSFDGNAQVLDHILITQNLLPRTDGLQMARSNGDFPEVLRNDPNSPARLTDHDGLVAYFNLPAAAPTTTELNSSMNPSAVGDAVTFTATVRSGATPVGEGTVTFREGPSILADAVALDASGHASFSTSSFTVGNHTVTAEYAGTKHWMPSSANLTQSVDPTVTINDVAVTEGNGAGSVATFTVSLSEASFQTVTVNFETAPATATENVDYARAAGSLTFAPGTTAQTIAVNIIGDRLREPAEDFFVNLSSPVNAFLVDSQGQGTIVDDDAPPPNVPSISGFTPGSGPAGTLVTITGMNFSGATAVRFNGTPTLFAVVNANTVRAIVPLTATTGPISVTNSHGTGTSEANFVALPKIVIFVPLAGRIGTEVTIVGTGFAGATDVRFNGVSGAILSITPISLRVIVPAGATTGPITVTTPSGSDRGPINFTVIGRR